jgi:hypothetical protein
MKARLWFRASPLLHHHSKSASKLWRLCVETCPPVNSLLEVARRIAVAFSCAARFPSRAIVHLARVTRAPASVQPQLAVAIT